MRRIRPVDFEPPLVDGAVLSPSFRMLGLAHAGAGRARERARRVRGSILTMCLDVRAALDGLIIAQGPGSRTERADILMAEAARWVERIEAVEPLLRRVFTGRAEILLYGLFESARLYRLIITRPFFIVAGSVSEASGDAARLAIADEQFVWWVDEEQLHEWQVLLLRCRTDLDRAAETLTAEAMRSPAA